MFKKQRYNQSSKFRFLINFIGNSWAAVINIAFVPLFLRHIGTEGYGLIGIFAGLQVGLSILDAGLSTTLNRELARLSVVSDSHHQMRITVRTLEIVYWAVSLFIGFVSVAISPFLAHHWINPIELTNETIQSAFILLSISFVFQLPIGFYSGGLLGLQKQITLSAIKIFFCTLRNAGALVVLTFFSSSILSFFSWIILINFIWVVVIWQTVWHSLPKPVGPKTIKFDKTILFNNMGFAAGMSGISFAAALLSQTDKFLLGKILTLSELGLYTFAQTYGMAVCSLIVPTFYQILFPKFTQMIENKDVTLYDFYLDNCQKLSRLLFPVIIALFFLSDVVFAFLYRLTVDREIGIQLFSIFLFAALINSTLHLPYNLFIAYGKSKYVFYLYLKIFIVFVILLYFGTLFWGIIGGAVANILLQLTYLVLLIRLIYKHLSFSNIVVWYKKVVIIPFVTFLLLFTFPNLFIFSSSHLMRIITNITILIIVFIFYEYRFNYFGIKKYLIL